MPYHINTTDYYVKLVDKMVAALKAQPYLTYKDLSNRFAVPVSRLTPYIKKAKDKINVG